MPHPGPRQPGQLRVLTYNILNRSDGWEDRRPLLVRAIKNLDADLLALQETAVADGYDQVVDLLGPDSGYHVIHHSARDATGMGISLASRWPLVAVRELDLGLTPKAQGYPIGTLAAEIHAPDPIGPLLFVNHFPSWGVDFEHERQVQAVAAARLIDEMLAGRRLPVVLGGDLDADPDAGSIRFWTGHQALDGLSVCYLDGWHHVHGSEPTAAGETFSPRNAIRQLHVPDWPFRRIDYLLVRYLPAGPYYAIERCELVGDESVDGVWPSDHFGVVADLVRS